MRFSAGHVWLIIVLLVLVFEIYAGATHHQTLSQWIWAAIKREPWVRWAVFAFMVALTIHFCFLRWP